ncbi:MAG: F-type H+-transporting ATPase subunit a [Candidatus Promineifilaceae bacterium]|jgi:F-type H+-transporting ATPase subunit a
MDKQKAVEQWVHHHTQVNPNEWSIPFVHIPLPEFLSLHGLMLVFCAAFLLIIFGKVYRKHDSVPTGVTNFLELFVLFIRDEVCVPHMGKEDGRRMTPIFCSIWFFVLSLNLMGLIPLFSTATANPNVTFGMATVTLLMMVVGGIYRNGFGGFAKSFVISGVPWPVQFILIPIELAGLIIKPVALMIRLFANMLAGHIILFSLLSLGVIYGSMALLPSLAISVAIYFLEIFVAFLQAYIFTLLSSMFVGSLLHPSH